MNDGPQHTFGHDSCRDMLDKLKREFNRLEVAPEREDIADHAINFAITSWHLTDWIWAAYEDKRLKFRGEAADASASWGKGRNGLGDFRKYIFEREPRIRYCDPIANEAKHLVLDEKRRPGRSVLKTTASASSILSGTGFLMGPVDWIPKILREGNRLDARLEFDCILDFWSSFIHGETREGTLEIVRARENAAKD